MDEVRTVQPLMAHRRNDLYELLFNEHVKLNDSDSPLMFGPNPIPISTVFCRTGLSFAFGINI